MEEKKFDKNTIIGFGLIFIIVMWMTFSSTQNAAKEDAEKKRVEKLAKIAKQKELKTATVIAAVKDTTKTDATKMAQLQGTLGSFAYSATLPSASETFTTLENDLISIKIANKGGYIAEAKLKKFEKFRKNSGQLVALIANNNSNFNLQLQTKDNRTLNSKELFFEPTLTKVGENQVLSMKLKASATEFLEYQYVLKPSDYMLDFNIKSSGLMTVLNTSKPIDLTWDLKTYRNEKSISYENRYTDVRYGYEDGKENNVGQGKPSEESPAKVNFVAFKQHFFTSILLTKTPIETSKLISNNLVNDEQKDTIFTKQFTAQMPLAFANGEIDYKMNWYFGPTDYKILHAYDKNLDSIIPFGWGIIGWINRYLFVPVFGFMSSFLMYGLAIILFSFLIKLLMSPITFKSFLSQAKMKVLRPEITEINDKFGKDAMKKQQETMKLYNKAGVNPMAGCIPALIQLPFMYASFQFFPAAIELRQKAFLWADDLSSFDSVISWKQHIPLLSSVYGNHISLFAVLAAIAIFFYMKMTSGDQQMQAPAQEGMPDMGKIMKVMIYLSPVMMLVFFNNYGSGLSLYNFIANLVTIGIMLVIKNYFIDTDKIHAQIQENKAKPKAEGKFQKKMREMMEQAEAQKALPKKK